MPERSDSPVHRTWREAQVVTLRALITDVVTAAVQHAPPPWLTGDQGDDLWQRLISVADMAPDDQGPQMWAAPAELADQDALL